MEISAWYYSLCFACLWIPNPILVLNHEEQYSQENPDEAMSFLTAKFTKLRRQNTGQRTCQKKNAERQQLATTGQRCRYIS
ncbi:hypothetical protein AVEN_21811-1 [Araneus ventricosus]|uniref:Uncharacterized protein n=1 Tax=Araneus ventricosus TaxID=182803 RepID=A0A4Y2XC43_ARAVE|nr:hypothetical protein AVEN_229277-1 [Araneus ventricosus]GBO45482.1 hypothetical protein AVEN_21811-1 [Araneus ventricosus]